MTSTGRLTRTGQRSGSNRTSRTPHRSRGSRSQIYTQRTGTTTGFERNEGILAIVEGRSLSRGQIGMAIVDPGRPVC